MNVVITNALITLALTGFDVRRIFGRLLLRESSRLSAISVVLLVYARKRMRIDPVRPLPVAGPVRDLMICEGRRAPHPIP
jgi:hypothetical protein